MDAILQEFVDDVAVVRRLLELVDMVGKFSATTLPLVPPADVYEDQASRIHVMATSCFQDLSLLSGTSVLYLAGRFESFVKNKFEELCDKICAVSDSFDSLPKPMRTNLIKMTGEVMMNDRRYGHAERGVQSFVSTLADNLADRSKLTNINSKCLSITSTNMRADIIDELYERIGAKLIWESIGEQAAVKIHFQTSENAHASNEAKKYLNTLMDQRNKIAHPSMSFTWPRIDEVLGHINYLVVLAGAITDVTEVYALPKKK